MIAQARTSCVYRYLYQQTKEQRSIFYKEVFINRQTNKEEYFIQISLSTDKKTKNILNDKYHVLIKKAVIVTWDKRRKKGSGKLI